MRTGTQRKYVIKPINRFADGCLARGVGEDESFLLDYAHGHPNEVGYIRLHRKSWKGNADMERNVPNHVAIILDGNGRWAKAKGLPRTAGHIQGAKAVEAICEDAYNMGINYLTVYAFSTENWNRPEKEVEMLMKLLRDYMKNSLKRAQKNNMCVRVLGDKSKLAADIQKSIYELEEATKKNTGLHFQIAINYGSRDEITRAVKKLLEQVEQGRLSAAEIDEQRIAAELDTAGLPDPDLMIRTSGEQRISNFMLWQLAYAEFYYTSVPWPDFDKAELEKAVLAYNNRDRRFGLVKEEG